MRKIGGVLVVLVSGLAHAQTPTGTALPVSAAAGVERFTATADPGSVSVLDGARTIGWLNWGVGLFLHYAHGPVSVCVDQGAGCDFIGDALRHRLAADLVGIIGLGWVDVHASVPFVLYQKGDFEPAPGSEAIATGGFGNVALGARVRLYDHGAFGAAFDGNLVFPGPGASFLGGTGFQLEPRLLGDFRRGKLAVAASLGFRFRTDGAHVGNVYLGHDFTWSLGGEYQIIPRLSAGLALYGAVGLSSDPDVPAGVDGSPGHGTRPTELLVTGRYQLTQNLGLQAGVGPGLVAGVGTPDWRAFVGVTWAHVVHDRDGDGVPDEADKCPDEYARTPDGCPIRDRDGDGVLDDVDKCPDEYAKTPDGCPIKDRDGDGVPDDQDKCPDIYAQTPDGCPPAPPPLVVVTAEKIEIRETIYFDYDKATIQDRSFALLAAVAQALKDNPKINVRIEGHTDDVGKPAYNLELSKRRAAAVKDHLVKVNGLDGKRLTTNGYGQTRPIDPAKTPDARAKNRRVEFVIVSR